MKKKKKRKSGWSICFTHVMLLITFFTSNNRIQVKAMTVEFFYVCFGDSDLRNSLALIERFSTPIINRDFASQYRPSKSEKKFQRT